MFEQSTIASGPRGKRLWTTCVGLTGEILLVACAILAPIVSPQVLPKVTFSIALVPPSPPPPPAQALAAVRPRTPHPRPTQFNGHALIAPTTVPAEPKIIVDAPIESDTPGIPGGVPGGSRDGVPGGILPDILTAGTPPVVPQPHVVEKPVAPVAVAPAAPQRVRGGDVHLAEPIYRPEPQYPQLARQMRIAGVVQLEGVIGVDGRLHELRVVNGHPLLAHAALEAVSRWIYNPTLLNGKPVEVIAPITVTFYLK